MEQQRAMAVENTQYTLQQNLEDTGASEAEATQTVDEIEDILYDVTEAQQEVDQIAKKANKALKENAAEKTEDGSEYLGTIGSLDTATRLYQAPKQTHAEIAFEATAEQLRILDANVNALDQRLADETLSDKARDIILSVKEVLIEQAHDIRTNWQSYGLVAAEALPLGIGTVVTVGHQGYDVYQGDQTIFGAAGTLAVEGAMGYVGGKAIKLVGKSVGKLTAKIGEKVAERQAAKVASNIKFERTKPIQISGKKSTIRGLSYENNIRQDLYSDIPFKRREYEVMIDGKRTKGVAACVLIHGEKNIAVEAKFVDKWDKSIRNPTSINGTKPWALKEQSTMIEQAKKYTSAFDEVIYHTNSQEFANHYSKVFTNSGINNYKFIITPTIFK